VSEFNLCLQPSRLAQRLLWLALPLPMLVLLANPVPIVTWLIVGPLILLYYFIWLRAVQRRQVSQQAALSVEGNLHWFAPINDRGRVKQGGLVSQYALRLNWYSDNQQQVLQQWIYYDQCLPNDYRALARVISQANWSVHDEKKD
jgi:hypothetical protein